MASTHNPLSIPRPRTGCQTPRPVVTLVGVRLETHHQSPPPARPATNRAGVQYIQALFADTPDSETRQTSDGASSSVGRAGAPRPGLHFDVLLILVEAFLRSLWEEISSAVFRPVDLPSQMIFDSDIRSPLHEWAWKFLHTFKRPFNELGKRALEHFRRTVVFRMTLHSRDANPFHANCDVLRERSALNSFDYVELVRKFDWLSDLTVSPVLDITHGWAFEEAVEIIVRRQKPCTVTVHLEGFIPSCFPTPAGVDMAYRIVRRIVRAIVRLREAEHVSLHLRFNHPPDLGPPTLLGGFPLDPRFSTHIMLRGLALHGFTPKDVVETYTSDSPY